MNILKAFSNLWHGSESKVGQPDDSPIVVETIEDESGSLIAKLSLETGGYDKLIKKIATSPSSRDKSKIILTINSRSNINTCYNVIFNNLHGIINIKCDCPAGELTKLCWHKLALVRGDSSMLADFCDMNDFHQIQKWLKKSSFPKLIIDHDKAEKIVLEGQRVLKKLKATIETAMKTGA